MVVSDDHYLFRADAATPTCAGVLDEENDGSFVRSNYLAVGDWLVLANQSDNCTQTVEITAIEPEEVTDWSAQRTASIDY